MSKMSEVSIEIQELLEDGETPVEIANRLNVPVTWVYATQELLDSQDVFAPN